MNVLFLGYWSANEGLSVSTIYPHIQVLSDFPFIDRVIYCSIEREYTLPAFSLQLPKVTHIPLHSPPSASVVLNKVRDFTLFPQKLSRIIKDYQIDLLICRGAPAGILGHFVHRRTNIPYWVESFEPHAQYMLESGVWQKWSIRYLVERLGENLQLKSAGAILPVAEGYRKMLIDQGVKANRLFTLPCTVDVEKFSFKIENRRIIREKLGMSDTAICGVYVGKFGDMYFDEEAFIVFRKAKEVYDEFFLMIISPQPAEEIEGKLSVAGFKKGEFFVGTLPHDHIPLYLHAADFAFALYKPSPSKRYLSPIKIGEYWAAGLPVLLTEGVGDESHILAEGSGGVLFNMGTVNSALSIMQKHIYQNDKYVYVSLAQRHRSRDRIEDTYRAALSLLMQTDTLKQKLLCSDRF